MKRTWPHNYLRAKPPRYFPRKSKQNDKRSRGTTRVRVYVILAARLIGLTALYFICFTVVFAAFLPAPGTSNSDADNAAMLGALLVVSFLNTVVLAYPIIRSRWGGWKLIITVFLVLFGVGTVMPQMETAVFITGLPKGMLSGLFLAGSVFAAVYALMAVLVLGKWRKVLPNRATEQHLAASTAGWIWRLSTIAAIYVVIYFTFGYFVAWRNPAVRSYYGGSDPGTFFSQMHNVLRGSPWLIALQAARGLLWAALAIPVIRMMRGRWWEAGLAVALLFAVLMSSPLLLPNPLMPQTVRLTHLLETTSSNFIFGWFAVWLLAGGKHSLEVPTTS